MAKSNVGKKPISEEEYTTNKVLTVFSVCLLGVLVLMILQRLLNYGSTFMIGLIVTKILLAIGIIGVVGGLVMLGMERTGRRNGSRRIICGRNLLIASVVMTVCMSAISYIGIAPIKALYVILPVLAVFYLVYHSYSTEFFVITVDCGAALGDDEALVGALADQALLVIGGHLELQALAVHDGDLALGPHLQTHGGGGDVGDVQLGAHGALTLGQAGGHGGPGGLLHQGAHPGGGEHGQGAGPGGDGGVLVVDHGLGLGLHTNGNRHDSVLLVRRSGGY